MSWDDLTDGIMECAEDVFGSLVTYEPKAGGTFEDMTMIFDDEHEIIDLDGDEAGVSSVQPMLGVRMQSFRAIVGADPLQEDELVVQKTGQRYQVVDVMQDGQAAWTLVLHKKG